VVLTVALISLVVALQPAEPQSATSASSPPYSISGVRRAAAARAHPSVDVDSTALDLPRRSTRGLTLESRTVDVSPCAQLVNSCQPTWAELGAPTWHSQFLGMTGPTMGSPFNSMAGNKDRLTAVASSVAFALAFQGVFRLVQRISGNAHQKKANGIRRDIEAEVHALEQLNRPSSQADPAVKKSPR
jgi:hypothetical protein